MDFPQKVWNGSSYPKIFWSKIFFEEQPSPTFREKNLQRSFRPLLIGIGQCDYGFTDPVNHTYSENLWWSNRNTNTMAKTRQWQHMFCRCLRLIHFLFLIISIHQAGDTADLICSYYLDSHNLYSVKWYKVNCYLWEILAEQATKATNLSQPWLWSDNPGKRRIWQICSNISAN